MGTKIQGYGNEWGSSCGFWFRTWFFTVVIANYSGSPSSKDTKGIQFLLLWRHLTSFKKTGSMKTFCISKTISAQNQTLNTSSRCKRYTDMRWSNSLISIKTFAIGHLVLFNKEALHRETKRTMLHNLKLYTMTISCQCTFNINR